MVSLFNSRVSGGKIRDCHGDLHAAHVCFSDDIYIYDCIEFNDRFRYCDTASEIAFLAMDIDRYGRADLSDSFVKAYVHASGDSELEELLNFYKCYRAYVRGKVACFKYDDPYLKDKDSILGKPTLFQPGVQVRLPQAGTDHSDRPDRHGQDHRVRGHRSGLWIALFFPPMLSGKSWPGFRLTNGITTALRRPLQPGIYPEDIC